jgi:hypothetical protein
LLESGGERQTPKLLFEACIQKAGTALVGKVSNQETRTLTEVCCEMSDVEGKSNKTARNINLILLLKSFPCFSIFLLLLIRCKKPQIRLKISFGQ